MRRHRELAPVRYCPVAEALVEDTVMNRALGVVPSYWGPILATVAAVTVAMLAFHIFGVTP